ncbi:MAG: ABC transporter permease [Armatimonadetes bacterium]|nr:ABC transporter permease [Armatimonadota bacterium]
MTNEKVRDANPDAARPGPAPGTPGARARREAVFAGAGRSSILRLLRDRRVLVPAVIIAILGAASLFANVVAPYEPNRPGVNMPYAPPSPQNLLGTDNAGRDNLSRLLYGGRLTLGISVGAVTIAAVVGLVAGVVAGYLGGSVDVVIMRSTDVVLCFPPIILAMAVVTFVGSRPEYLTLVIAALYAPRFARVVYAAVQTVKFNAHVEAARAMGATTVGILRREIVPNVMAPVMVQYSLAIGHAILLETGLSFIGLGPPPPSPSWGRMIEEARRFMEQQILLLVWPSVVIGLSVISFNALGDALRDALDPKLRQSVSVGRDAA